MGGGRIADARALVLHALVLGAGLALLFTLLAWTVLPALYRLLGGEGQALDNALVYSHVLFNRLAHDLGQLLPVGAAARRRRRCDAGRYMLFASLAQVPLSYVLALGIGDWPGLGMAGPAVSSAADLGGIGAPAGARAVAGQAGLHAGAGRHPTAGSPVLGHPAGRADRLVLGLHANLTAMMVTGLVGRFGVAALAGYGIGVRLEFMLVPLAFGIGSGLTTLVGVASGAHDWKRAVRVAWIGGLIAAGALGVCGWIVALIPEGWARLFTSDPQVVAATVAYITRVAPVLLPIRARHDALLREPRGRPHDGTIRRRHHSPPCRHGRRMVRCGNPRLGPARRLHGNRRRHGLLRRPDRRPTCPPPLASERVKLFPQTGGSDAASLDDPNLEPQPR